MTLSNPIWLEERIANELLLKLGIRVSPRTIRQYLPKRPGGQPRGDLRWSTIVRSHAAAILACTFCERFIGTRRRECHDFMIPLTERHLRVVLSRWVAHYNQGRSHASRGPGIPDPSIALPITPHEHRHIIPGYHRVVAQPILGGLHHDYGLVPKVA